MLETSNYNSSSILALTYSQSRPCSPNLHIQPAHNLGTHKTLIVPIRNEWNLEVLVHYGRYVGSVISTVATTRRADMITMKNVNMSLKPPDRPGIHTNEQMVYTEPCFDEPSGTIMCLVQLHTLLQTLSLLSGTDDKTPCSRTGHFPRDKTFALCYRYSQPLFY